MVAKAMNQTPVQSEPKPRRTFRPVGPVLAMAFVCCLAGAWHFTPAVPYATLNVGAECNRAFFSPDGAVLVTVGPANAPTRIWDVAGGTERFSINSGGAVFSPDSRILAAREWNGPLTLWETATGKVYASFRPKTREDRTVPFQFSPDGRYLLCKTEGDFGARFATFWNIQSRQEEMTLEPEEDRLARAIARGEYVEYLFAPGGRTFAAVRPQKRILDNGACHASMWRMAKPPELLKEHYVESASALAVSPDLQSFASIEYPEGKGELALRDMETGEKRWALPLDENHPHPDSLWFEAGGKVIVGRGDTYDHKDGSMFPVMSVTIWDAASAPKQIGALRRERAAAGGAPAVSPDGKWFAIPLPAGAKLAKVATPEQGTDLVVEDDFTPQPTFGFRWIEEKYPTPEFSADGKMLLVHGLARPARQPFLDKWLPARLNPFRGREQTSLVRVWDVESGTEAFRFEDCSVWPSPNGSVVATLTDRQTIDLWAVPLRPSIGKILGWAALSWSAAVFCCTLAFMAKRAMRGRWSVKP